MPPHDRAKLSERVMAPGDFPGQNHVRRAWEPPVAGGRQGFAVLEHVFDAEVAQLVALELLSHAVGSDAGWVDLVGIGF